MDVLNEGSQRDAQFLFFTQDDFSFSDITGGGRPELGSRFTFGRKRDLHELVGIVG
jgi:hypothetical protein